MRRFQSIFAVFCALLTTLDAQSFRWATQPYQPKPVAPVNLANSTRLEALLRNGKLYLSLQDAIALALENNVDIEVERYLFPLAQADVLRAQSGNSSQGFSTATSAGATGLNTTQAQSYVGFFSGGGFSANPNLAGYDPVVNSTVQWAHISTPQQNTVTTGTTSLISTNTIANFSVQDNFPSGGSVTLSYDNTLSSQNSYLNLLNPTASAYIDLSFAQPLLQGFGPAFNNRPIRVAKNNLKAADLVFKQQVIVTVQTVVQAYWLLVSYNEDVEVKRQALALSQKLYSDNQKQVEAGSLAPIEVVRAEAEIASNEQALVTSQTNVLQQETILKNALSRNGLATPALASARIVPTDKIKVPDVESAEAIEDLFAAAVKGRPELQQSRIQLENQKILLTGTRNLMLPTLSAFADARNSGLAGDPNTLPIPGTDTPYASNQNPFFLGGYGTALGQVFRRNFPNYSVGFSLSIPLRNRNAQANYATAAVNLRQNELSVQRLTNQVHVDVQNALITLQQARAQYRAAVKSRILQQQTLDAENKKFAVGASTPFLVIQAQRDLANAGGAEVVAEAVYIQAKLQLDVATGRELEVYNIQIDEARQGRVSKAPDPIPAESND
ncbi:MAG TPA: TolC family protein [Bryobacteraceae bacterium]|nr:TolC family protein [Bryobacteraceae bacterium]